MLLRLINGPAILENDPDKDPLGSLEKGEAIRYKISMKMPRSLSRQNKQRIYDEPREFLCNYKTALVREEALQNAVDGNLEEGLAPWPFSESELRAKFPKYLPNAIGEISKISKTRCMSTSRCGPMGVAADAFILP